MGLKIHNNGVISDGVRSQFATLYASKAIQKGYLNEKHA